MSRRLQRTASTAPREKRWWKRIPLTTGALAIAVQSVMSGALIVTGGVPAPIPLAALAFAGISLNSRNALVLGAPGVLTLGGAAFAFGTGWASVPVLGALGIGSWAVTYLTELARDGRREQVTEGVAMRKDLIVAGGVAGLSAVLTALVFLVTLVPKIPFAATLPLAATVAAAVLVATAVSVRQSREQIVGNEDYFRVGTALETTVSSAPDQVALRDEIDLEPLLEAKKNRQSRRNPTTE